jgi:hypothetical protein
LAPWFFINHFEKADPKEPAAGDLEVNVFGSKENRLIVVLFVYNY